MQPHEKKKLIRLYASRHREMGYDVKTVGWSSVETQVIRFQVLADIGDMTGGSIADIGCGFGDMLPYLLERFGNVRYHGVDLVEELISEAKLRYATIPEDSASFEVRDILEEPLERRFDFVVSSGALNFRIEDNASFVVEMLHAMYSACRSGVAVNFLSSYVDYQAERNFHMDPERALSMAKRITRWVSLRHDYNLYEFTLYLYRQPMVGGQ